MVLLNVRKLVQVDVDRLARVPQRSEHRDAALRKAALHVQAELLEETSDTILDDVAGGAGGQRAQQQDNGSGASHGGVGDSQICFGV